MRSIIQAAFSSAASLLACGLMAVSPLSPIGPMAPAGLRAQTDSSPNAVAAGVVNVNVATLEELQLLPGIGTARAQAIMEYRKNNGPFKAVEDLLAISGIGQKALARLRPFVVLEGKTTLRPRDTVRAPSSR